MPIWTKIEQSNINDLVADIIDSIETTKDEKNRVEFVFLQGRLAYIQTYVRDKGEIYERIENKYHVASLQDIVNYWRLDREQLQHERRIKSDMGSSESY